VYYGVVLREDRSVDRAASERLRAALRAARTNATEK
jgi:hypothetical protein